MKFTARAYKTSRRILQSGIAVIAVTAGVFSGAVSSLLTTIGSSLKIGTTASDNNSIDQAISNLNIPRAHADVGGDGGGAGDSSCGGGGGCMDGTGDGGGSCVGDGSCAGGCGGDGK